MVHLEAQVVLKSDEIHTLQQTVQDLAAELEVERSDVKAVLEEIYGIGDKLNSVFESLSDQVCATIAAISCPQLVLILGPPP